MGYHEDVYTVTITEEWIKDYDRWLIKVINEHNKLLHTFTVSEEELDAKLAELGSWYNVKEIKVLGTV